MLLAAHTSLVTRAICCMRACGPFCCSRMDPMGSLVGAAGPVCWFARLYCGWRPLASGWQSQVTGQLAAEPCLPAGLVLTVGWSLVPGWMAAEPDFLDLVLACWWIGSPVSQS